MWSQIELVTYESGHKESFDCINLLPRVSDLPALGGQEDNRLWE